MADDDPKCGCDVRALATQGATFRALLERDGRFCQSCLADHFICMAWDAIAQVDDKVDRLLLIRCLLEKTVGAVVAARSHVETDRQRRRTMQ